MSNNDTNLGRRMREGEERRGGEEGRRMRM